MKLKKTIITLLALLLVLTAMPLSVFAEEAGSITASDSVSYDNDYIANEIFGYKEQLPISIIQVNTSDIPFAIQPDAEPVYNEMKTVGDATYEIFLYADGSYNTTTCVVTETDSTRALTYYSASISWNNLGGGCCMELNVRYSINESTGAYALVSASKGYSVTGTSTTDEYTATYTPRGVGITSATRAHRAYRRTIDYVDDRPTEITDFMKKADLVWNSQANACILRSVD